jgi:hypothetical protein
MLRERAAKVNEAAYGPGAASPLPSPNPPMVRLGGIRPTENELGPPGLDGPECSFRAWRAS